MKRISVVLIDYRDRRIRNQVIQAVKHLPFEIEIFTVNLNKKSMETTLTELIKRCWKASTGSYILSLSQDVKVTQYDCGRLLFPLIDKEVDLCEHDCSNSAINPYSFHRSQLRWFMNMYKHGASLPKAKVRYKKIRSELCLS